MTRASHRLGAVSLLVLAGLAATPAYAAGTTAGSTVTNTVQVNFQVGGVAQTPVSASDTFTVDRKVNVTVAEVGSTTTQTSPGQLAAVTTFTVTNLSNATLDFALAAAQQVGGAGAHSNTDNFDVTNVKIYVDSNTNGVYDAGTDTLVTYLDELAADASKTVFVVADIPVARVTNDVAAVTLTATGREGGTAATQGIALVQTATANTASMDTVFADGAGATDAARDAAFSAKDDYTILAAALSATKTSRVISDPFNNTTNPKMIPGAVVEYCIAVANASGSATATSVALSDILPAATTYQASFGILMNGTVTGATCNADGVAGGAYNAGTTTVSGTLASIVAADTRTLVFRVTIN
ncbi:MAG: hypothetical protein ABIO86_18605 [Sphingomonas sp.]